MGDNPSTGTTGENKAVQFLKAGGYIIIERNFRTIGIEIDIIAQKDDTLCFIEVKTRKSNHFGRPEEFVNHKKRKRIITAASLFANKRKYSDCFLRFDIISILYRDKLYFIDHIVNAFET